MDKSGYKKIRNLFKAFSKYESSGDDFNTSKYDEMSDDGKFMRTIYADDMNEFFNFMLFKRGIEFFTFEKIAEIKKSLEIDPFDDINYHHIFIEIAHDMHAKGGSGDMLHLFFYDIDGNETHLFTINSNKIVADVYIEFIQYVSRCLACIYDLSFKPDN